MNKPFFSTKIAIVTAVVTITFFVAAQEARSALIDWAKHEEWRRKQLEALVSEVNLKGSAPYVIMSFRDYDTNGDSVIDRDEISAVKDVLNELPATRPKK